jgi:hypothetical protein
MIANVLVVDLYLNDASNQTYCLRHSEQLAPSDLTDVFVILGRYMVVSIGKKCEAG